MKDRQTCKDTSHARIGRVAHPPSTHLKKSSRQYSFASREKHFSASGHPQSEHWTHLECQARSRTLRRNRSVIGLSHPAHSAIVRRCSVDLAGRDSTCLGVLQFVYNSSAQSPINTRNCYHVYACVQLRFSFCHPREYERRVRDVPAWLSHAVKW